MKLGLRCLVAGLVMGATMMLNGCGNDNYDNDTKLYNFILAQSQTRQAIVFMAYSSGAQQVWGMRSDGSQKVSLAGTTGGRAIQGVLSPNGRKLLYVSQISVTGSEIVEKDLQSGALTVLFADPSTTGNDYSPTYSPDGTKIAYHDDKDGIHVMNVDGTNNLLLLGTSSIDHTPSWNKAGTKIVFDRGWNGDIYVMNPDGSGQTLVVARTETDTYGQPKFLPDGRIICMRNSSASKDIVIMNADGSGLVNLTPGTDTSDEFFPSVSSDGTQIAFSTDRNTQNDVYVGNLSGTTVTNLVNISADRSTNCWRPSFGI